MAESSPSLAVVEHVGQLMQFWGFRRPMGRIWALAYLTGRPLSAAEIGDELTMSAGAVSMAISDLIRWGALRKVWLPGDRRDYYEVETHIWKLVRRVLRERELRMVREFIQTLETALGDLAHRSTGEEARIVTLRDLARVGERLLCAVTDGEPVDPASLSLIFSEPPPNDD